MSILSPSDLDEVHGRIGRARKILDQTMPKDLEYNQMALWHATRAGRLEYYLEEMIDVVEQLVAQ